jgi:hypothetical protein
MLNLRNRGLLTEVDVEPGEQGHPLLLGPAVVLEPSPPSGSERR